MRDSLTGAGPGNLKISFQGANHEGTFKRTWWQLVPRTLVSCSRPRPFQYSSCTTSRPPETAVPVLKLYYQRTKIQPAAKVVLYQRMKIQPATGVPVLKLYCYEKPGGRRRRLFQYYSCTTRERKTSWPLKRAVPVLQLYYQRTEIPLAAGPRERKSSRTPESAVPVLSLYYQRTKSRPAAGDGR